MKKRPKKGKTARKARARRRPPAGRGRGSRDLEVRRLLSEDEDIQILENVFEREPGGG